MAASWFCKNIDRPHLARRLRAIGMKGLYWTPGSTITVSFTGGTDSERQMVQNTLNLPFINIEFKFVRDGMIRVGFENDGAWSEIGTNCLEVDGITLNLGWVNKQVILHEFGHALGLLHEHQQPNNPIKWNAQQVIKDLSGAPNNWSLQTIKDNVLIPYNPLWVDATERDSDSVMMYPIPISWTLDGFHTDGGSDFSPTDISFLKSLYPFVLNPYIDMLRKIFLKPLSLSKLNEAEIVRMGGLIGASTNLGLTKSQNLNLVIEKLF